MPTKLETQLTAREIIWPALAPDEERLCAVRAQVPSDFRSPIRMLGAIGSAIEKADFEHKNPLPFALSREVAIAVTTARFVFWSFDGMFLPHPRTLLGELSRAAVEKVALSRRGRTLAFWMAPRSLELTVRERDLDDAAAFAAACA